MKKTTLVMFYALLLVVIVYSVQAQLFDNWFQKAKEQTMEFFGGDNNPMVAAMKKAMEESGFDDFQKAMHDEFDKQLSTASDGMKQHVEEMKSKFQEMTAGGSKREEIMKRMMEMAQKQKN